MTMTRSTTKSTPRESDLNPFLQDNFAPWRVEGDAFGLEVEGEIPRDLVGTYYRNGPNPAFEPPVGAYHWFGGDGMIHAVTLAGGRASYRNRYVMSRGLAEERAAGRPLYAGFAEPPSDKPRGKNVANTNVVAHAGRLLALVESSLPTELRAETLETLGEYDFGGRLQGAMTAHPKIDPLTGELVFFGNHLVEPKVTLHVADRSGALVQSRTIEVPWPSMIHDFALSRDHVIFLVGPVVFDMERATRGEFPFAWEPERGARIGVMPRRGGGMRWFDVDACYVFHPMNAYDDGDAVVVDVARYERMDFLHPRASRDPAWTGDRQAKMHRFRVDLRAGSASSTPLDDVSVEFPRMDERRLGSPYRFGYVAAAGPEAGAERLPIWTAIRKYDLARSTFETRPLGEGNGASEPLFVPRSARAAEDDGYVIFLSYDRARDASDFWILDAQNIAGEPVARVRLPHRVPYGFHGNWVPAA